MPERSVSRPRNVGASVRQGLLSLAQARGEPLELLLTRYVLERLQRRLSLSPRRERFVLEGARLLATWFDGTYSRGSLGAASGASAVG